MTRSEIIGMLKELVSEVDYDIYKAIYVEDCMEDPDEAKETQERLIAIAKEHMRDSRERRYG